LACYYCRAKTEQEGVTVRGKVDDVSSIRKLPGKSDRAREELIDADFAAGAMGDDLAQLPGGDWM
jgi:hypothetical protein